MNLNNIIYISIGISLLSLIVAFLKNLSITSIKINHKKSEEIAGYIRQGSVAFLTREYQILAIVIVVLSVLLFFLTSGSQTLIIVSFILGAIFSGLSGYIGMNIATLANVKAALAGKESLNKALKVAFNGGGVMGLGLVGFGLLGVSILFLALIHFYGSDFSSLKMTVFPILNGFILGSAIFAVFARVGGGIFTKAADIGADLVGKLEKGIPEDDPRNPAVIADNVGDNVGDTAGMGSDIFSSYVASIIISMSLSLSAGSIELTILPLLIASVGIFFSILASFFIKTSENGNVHLTLNIVTLSTAILTIISLYFILGYFLKDQVFTIEQLSFDKDNIFYTITLGLIAGILIGFSTEYYTKVKGKPVSQIVNASKSGGATNLLAGLSLGMRSTVIPIFIIVIAILVSYHLTGAYGIALASLGMLVTIGIQLTVDALGPIADNAGGIAEMAELGDDVRRRTDILDAVGNTTASIGKGFAIGSTALTGIALFLAYTESSSISAINLTGPFIIIGILLGAMIPFIFSSLAISAVNKAAFSIIDEVRRQFKEIKGLMEGKATPDYKRCVDISTRSSMKEMILPGLIALISPLLIGFYLGGESLGGFLIGIIVSSILMGTFMINAGSAWDNAKKQIESGDAGGKGTDTHKATVVGDSVGDPFKDTSGPSLNILIKLVAIIALVIEPYL